ncbi:MAG: hypothetical protein NZO58_13505, partial [Gemmataceae bacterium]|nr:hypothetical protein [Gemmataceae bacterium]
MIPVDPERLEAAYRLALDTLLKERHPEGYWVGELASSALATATAVMALYLYGSRRPRGDRILSQTERVTLRDVQRERTTFGDAGCEGEAADDVVGERAALIDAGLRWLVEHQNADGGWGDTDRSFSNISTTMLCRAAFYLTGKRAAHAEAVARAERWLCTRYGSTPAQLAAAVRQRYGSDRTFATPILTTCALAGLVDWREVPPLPFELACLPQAWFRFLRLHVVSYALPALIAIGQCIYHHRKPRNPLTRLARQLAIGPSLRVLERIQPTSGGFLEATPLTSFVTLSLAACGRADHVVARNGVGFLLKSVRPDGSWPIDTNLSTWVTTLAVNALAAAGELERLERRDELCTWLLRQQFAAVHPYTGAAPGGWAWTPLPGGVPDADDTPGAIHALANRAGVELQRQASAAGRDWLTRLQNSDGGVPTFCRGWGRLPFDRSGCDLTAHALRAVLPSIHEAMERKESFWTLQIDGPPILLFAEFALDFLTSQ